MRYVLLLRGINVGGRNKIVMAELRQAVADLGYDKVETYINSGNLFFDSTKNRGDIVTEFQTFSQKDTPCGAICSTRRPRLSSRNRSASSLVARRIGEKGCSLFTEGLDKQAMVDYIQSLHLGDEVLHLSEHAIYWGKYTEGSYLQTAYHKQLAKSPFTNK